MSAARDTPSKRPSQPYYEDDFVTLYNGDSREILPALQGVVVTDPPYNVGYQYDGYDDRLSDYLYADLLSVTCRPPSVVIHYPEAMFDVASALGIGPEKTAAWVYNGGTRPRKWRMVGWFGVEPRFSDVRQPYKNSSDKRIRAKVESDGAALYDWWHIELVKNVSSSKTAHPCQIPLDLMRRIVGVTPAEFIIDPFAGSGTTLRAAKDLGRKVVGIELSEAYCEIAALRCAQEILEVVA